MAVTRISSQDSNYSVGQLSVYPTSLDTKYQLYQATNNSQTTLKQSLTYSGQYLIVDDNTNFPNNGIVRVGSPPGEDGVFELVYYDSKTTGVFRNLIRGFAGSRQNPWSVGSYVSNGVFADYHNASKDAIINIETNLGTENLPSATSLNGILQQQETRFLAPRPLFAAYPKIGPPALKVKFQNFSVGPLIRYLWDFGDGTTSIEKSPIHIYQNEGIYSVKLNVITSLGAQGIITKSNYITVDETAKQPFFYTTPINGISRQTAEKTSSNPTTFSFVDQTDGDIIQRYWVFDGAGTNEGNPVPTQSIPELDPNIHTISYIYDLPGIYQPSLLILFENQQLQKAFLNAKITVI